MDEPVNLYFHFISSCTRSSRGTRFQLFLAPLPETERAKSFKEGWREADDLLRRSERSAFPVRIRDRFFSFSFTPWLSCDTYLEPPGSRTGSENVQVEERKKERKKERTTGV